jgi:hypothetical protein
LEYVTENMPLIVHDGQVSDKIAPRTSIRLVHGSAGPSLVVQTPDGSEQLPGWQAYRVEAQRIDLEEPVQLTLYERAAPRPGEGEDPQAA